MMSPLKPAQRSFSPAPAQPARDVSGEAAKIVQDTFTPAV